jgi:hypothetical protein
LDRVLDKGIVIDAWASVSLLGVEILTVKAQVVAASVETYLKYAAAISSVGLSQGGGGPKPIEAKAEGGSPPAPQAQPPQLAEKARAPEHPSQERKPAEHQNAR